MVFNGEVKRSARLNSWRKNTQNGVFTCSDRMSDSLPRITRCAVGQIADSIFQPIRSSHVRQDRPRHTPPFFLLAQLPSICLEMRAHINSQNFSGFRATPAAPCMSMWRAFIRPVRHQQGVPPIKSCHVELSHLPTTKMQGFRRITWRQISSGDRGGPIRC
ncbi:hypothetical protein Syun_025503 [Stephania yunnanensis]|uniref:Uncharacterized protein n=1 Tax=Stephania yunnanensis TaxID=152371 RepID=A0AAP0HRB5_9MAGN